MISRSDDPATSALWVRYDGARMVRDVARFLALLPVLAHPDDAERLLGWMRAATPVAADGFSRRFGLFGAGDGRAGVKQGWMCCLGGKRHVHSVGVLGRTVVVLLAEVPRRIG